MIGRLVLAAFALATLAPSASALEPARSQDMDVLVATHAKANGIPEDLVHRVIRRESRYNARAVGRGGTLGLMQIKAATARGVGYTGPAAGLLDANTNLTYGVRYLAGAYRVAGGDSDRAVGYFARGYYYAAKRKGLPTSEPTASIALAPGSNPVVQTTGSISKTFGPLSFAAAQPAPERESKK